MANVKISDLASKTTPADNDLLEIVDVAGASSKKVTRSDLFKNPPLADGAITPAMLLTGTGSSWVWQSYTPTWTGLTVGNATQESFFVQIGKTVIVKVKLTMGNTTSFSAGIYCTLPVAPSSNYNSSGRVEVVGFFTGYDSSAGLTYAGWNGILSNSGMKFQGLVASTAGTSQLSSGISNTSPFTWATSDILVLTAEYEAA